MCVCVRDVAHVFACVCVPRVGGVACAFGHGCKRLARAHGAAGRSSLMTTLSRAYLCARARVAAGAGRPVCGGAARAHRVQVGRAACRAGVRGCAVHWAAAMSAVCAHCLSLLRGATQLPCLGYALHCLACTARAPPCAPQNATCVTRNDGHAPHRTRMLRCTARGTNSVAGAVACDTWLVCAPPMRHAPCAHYPRRPAAAR